MLDYSKSAEKTSPTVLLGVHHPIEKKTREYPTLKLVNINSTQIPRYKERETPVIHIEQVSRNIGEHG